MFKYVGRRVTYALRLVVTAAVMAATCPNDEPAPVDGQGSPRVLVVQAVEMVQFLEDLVAGQSGAAELEGILDGPSYQAMFGHYNRSWRPDHLPREAFRGMILGLAQGPHTVSNHRAAQMLPRWSGAVGSLPQLKRDIMEIETLVSEGLVDRALANAAAWLPDGAAVPVSNVHLLLDGGSFPWVNDGNVGVDVLQLPRTPDGDGIDLDALTPMLAHEFHHLGLAAAWGAGDTSGLTEEESLALRFLRLVTAEGSAIKFVNNAPGGRAPPVADRATPDFSVVMHTDWKLYRSEESEILTRAQDLLRRMLSGDATATDLAEEMRSYWLPGPPRALGRNYYLGAEWFGAIYHARGWEAAARLMVDPRCLLREYADAASDLPGFADAPGIDRELAEGLCTMGRWGEDRQDGRPGHPPAESLHRG